MPVGFSSYWSQTTKTAKAPEGWANYILLMGPSEDVPLAKLCPHAGLCASVCLRFSGRNPMARPVQEARARVWAENRTLFLLEAKEELRRLVKREARKGNQVCARFDGLSDTGDAKVLAEALPQVQFVDYTKDKQRYWHWLLYRDNFPPNWHLTFSRDRQADNEFCRQVLGLGGTAAVVFFSQVPKEWEGYPVIDGDAHDLRFMDPRGVVVGLKVKGKGIYTANRKVKQEFVL